MKAADWDARYAAEELVWGVAPNRFVERELATLPPGRAIDLACGEGRNAIWLAALGWTVTAVDFSTVAIEKAQELAAGIPVDWRVADLVEFVPQPRAFDLVLLSYLQIPHDDRAVIWPRAADAVAPGGTLLVVGHDSRNLTDGCGGPQSPEVLYTAADVVALIGDLDVVKAGEEVRQVANGQTAIDCLVRAERAPESR